MRNVAFFAMGLMFGLMLAVGIPAADGAKVVISYTDDYLEPVHNLTVSLVDVHNVSNTVALTEYSDDNNSYYYNSIVADAKVNTTYKIVVNGTNTTDTIFLGSNFTTQSYRYTDPLELEPSWWDQILAVTSLGTVTYGMLAVAGLAVFAFLMFSRRTGRRKIMSSLLMVGLVVSAVLISAVPQVSAVDDSYPPLYKLPKSSYTWSFGSEGSIPRLLTAGVIMRLTIKMTMDASYRMDGRDRVVTVTPKADITDVTWTRVPILQYTSMVGTKYTHDTHGMNYYYCDGVSMESKASVGITTLGSAHPSPSQNTYKIWVGDGITSDVTDTNASGSFSTSAYSVRIQTQLKGRILGSSDTVVWGEHESIQLIRGWMDATGLTDQSYTTYVNVYIPLDPLYRNGNIKNIISIEGEKWVYHWKTVEVVGKTYSKVNLWGNTNIMIAQTNKLKILAYVASYTETLQKTDVQSEHHDIGIKYV